MSADGLRVCSSNLALRDSAQTGHNELMTGD